MPANHPAAGRLALPYQRLYVNIDHVATVRQARRGAEPSPVEAALLCERAGADGITAHLREDRRHIQDADVEALRVRLTTPFNLELATSDDLVALACRLRPWQATLVPERREEVTTEGGLSLDRPDRREHRERRRRRQLRHGSREQRVHWQGPHRLPPPAARRPR